MNTSSTIGADANTTFTLSGSIGGPGDLTKVGVGTLALGVASTYTGNTNVTAGIVSISIAASLGAITGTVTVSSGASLQVAAAVTIVGKSLVLNGTGFGNAAGQSGALTQGALVATTTTGSAWNGNITLANGASIGAASGIVITVNGVVGSSDASGLTKVGLGTVQLNDSNTFLGNLSVFAGPLILANTNVYTGTTTVSGAAINGTFTGGTLTFTGLGTAINSSSFTVNQNSNLLLDNTAAVASPSSGYNSSGRISSTASITLNTATLQFNAANIAGTASSETFGALTLASGQSVITAGYTAAANSLVNTAVTFGSITRNTGATVNFNGTNLALGGAAGATSFNRILFSNSASVTGLLQGGSSNTAGGILPFAEVQGGANGTDLATYNQGLNPNVTGSAANVGIAGYSGYSINPTAPGAGDIVLINAATTFTSTSFGALLITGAVTVTPPALTLAITTGTIATSAAATIAAGTINLGSEGVIFQNAATTMNATLAGSTLLDVAGSNTLALGTTSNTYSGGTNLNAGTLTTGASGNPLGLGALTLTGGTFSPGVSLSNAINLNGLINFGANTTFLGSTTLTSNAILTNSVNPTTITFDEAVGESGGSHSLTVVAGTAVGTVVLNNANSYSGGTILAAPATSVLQVGHGNALGSGPLTLVSGTIDANVAVNLGANAVMVPNTAVTIGGANNLIFSNAITLIGNAAITVSNTAQTIFNGTIGGTGQLDLVNAGTTILAPTSGANTYTGGTTVTAGTLITASTAALSTGTLILSAATLFASSALSLANNVIFVGNTTFSGLLSSTGSGAITFSGLAYLDAATTLTVLNSTTFNGVIGESGGSRLLTLNGTGTLTLNGANYFSGGTTVNAVSASAANVLGTLALGTGFGAGAIGSTLTLTTGVLQANNAIAIYNPVSIGTARPSSPAAPASTPSRCSGRFPSRRPRRCWSTIPRRSKAPRSPPPRMV